jgi:perosamine synthetase
LISQTDQQAESFVLLDPCRDYPAPRLPVLPQISCSGYGHGQLDSPLLQNRAIFVNAGRTALQLIAQHLPTAGAFLLPSYHCPTMITPALSTGRKIRFYRIDEQLNADITDIAQHLRQGDVAAVLLPHYFGFPQTQITTIAALAHASGAWLIEDCAHALFGNLDGKPLGSFGDYAIASTRKFFPGRDGGALLINQGPAFPVDLPHYSLRDEMQALYDLLQQASLAERRRALTTGSAPATAATPATPSPTRNSMPLRQGLRSSRWIWRNQNSDQIASRRRQLFQRWLHHTLTLTGARPLFDTLPAHVVPYMFPLLLEQPARDFAPLKRAGVPIWRWDELMPSGCANSQKYGLALLQLPCHQSLKDADVDWMAETLRRTLASTEETT